jgi:hypothetical protein
MPRTTSTYLETISQFKELTVFYLIIKEFDKKIEGEEESKSAVFLSLCSVWNKDSEVPLNTLVSAESTSGKSFICKNIVKIFPKELLEQDITGTLGKSLLEAVRAVNTVNIEPRFSNDGLLTFLKVTHLDPVPDVL